MTCGWQRLGGMGPEDTPTATAEECRSRGGSRSDYSWMIMDGHDRRRPRNHQRLATRARYVGADLTPKATRGPRGRGEPRTASSSSRLLALVVLVLATLAPPVWAWQPRAGDMANGPRGDEAMVDEAPARVFYLEDEDGQLVPVPGFTLRDFDRMLLQERPTRTQATAALQAFSLAGGVRDGLAEMQATLLATTEAAGWTPVPLRLADCVLADFQVEGPDAWRLEAGDEGYVLWLRREEAGIKEHRVQFRLLTEVATTGAGQRLRLALPLASSNQVELAVPQSDAEATVARPGLLDSATSDGKRTTFVLRPGLDGRLDVGWSQPTPQQDRPVPVSRVVGAIVARFDGPAVRSEVSLTLETLQRPLTTFRVRLPRRTQLVGEPRVEQDGALVEATIDTLAGTSPLVEVRLQNPTQGPLTLTCSALHLPDDDNDDDINLLGFEVLQAGQQTGQLAVHVSEGWQLSWQRRRSVEQIEIDALSESLRADSPSYAFEYFSQPAILRARVLRPRTRVSVEPNYSFLVFPDHVELLAHLRYQAPTPGVRQLVVSLPAGWEPDLQSLSSLPPGLIDRRAASTSDDQRWSIPLNESVRGSFEVELRATRRLDDGLNPVILELPRPEVDSLGPATVRIQPANNLRLSPEAERMVGLSRLPDLGGGAHTGEWQQPALAYRTAVATARFVATGQVLPRELRLLRSEVEATIDGSALRVAQVVQYEALHEPADEVLFEWPEGRDVINGLDVFLGDRPTAAPERVITDEGPRMRVRLDGGQLGAFRLTLVQSLPLGDGPPGSSFEGRVDLYRPDWPQPIPTRLRIAAPQGTEVAIGGEEWTAVGNLRESPRRAADLPKSLTLLIETPDPAQPTRIARAWAQTWLVGNQRRDRIGLLLEASPGELRLQLPEGTDGSTVLVSVGGVAVTPELRPDGDSLLLTIPLANVTSPVTIELRYAVSTMPGLPPSALELPRSDNPGRWGLTYWELLLPSDVHLVEAPSGLAPEYVWGWETLGWGRRPVFDPQFLAAWVGLANTPPLPPGVNRYLFSHWGHPPAIQPRIIPRTWLVMIASLGALVGGLALVYLPWLRHRAMLLLLAIALGAVAWWQAELAPLFAQAALLGIGLAAVAGVMRTLDLRRRSRGRLVRSGGSSVTARPLPDLWQAAAVDDGSTAAATVVRQLPSA